MQTLAEYSFLTLASNGTCSTSTGFTESPHWLLCSVDLLFDDILLMISGLKRSAKKTTTGRAIDASIPSDATESGVDETGEG